MRKISWRAWTIPLAVLVICLTSFGVMLSKLRFYWDDWTILYTIHFLGIASFQEAFAIDRPLMAGIYKIVASLFGENSLNWQIYALIMRWLCGVAFWWTLKVLWGERLAQISAVSFLFIVYPGFNQQFIAITYGNAFLFYTFFLLSLGLMIWAFQKPSWFWLIYLSSICLSGYSMFLVEYFFGLELLRPILLWITLENQSGNPRQRLRKTFQYWLPYLLLMIVFLAWRIATPTPRAEIDIFQNLATNPISTVIALFTTVVQDIYKVSVMAWRQVFHFDVLLNYPANVLTRYVFVLLFAGIFSFLFLFFLGAYGASMRSQQKSAARQWAWQAIGIGLFSLLAAGIPIWMTDLRIELFFPWDRFTLPMMPGASLLLVGLISLLVSNRNAQLLLISAFIALAAGMHYQSALRYRAEWLLVRDFFWQLTWRAPGIEPGTTILAPGLPFEFDWDNSLTSPLNWSYAPDNKSGDFLYLLYNLEDRLSIGLPNLKENNPLEEQHRLMPFEGDTSQILSITFQPPACLKVLDPLNDQRIPDKPRFFQVALAFSKTELISLEPDQNAQPPLHLLGPEPEHDWCYTYEKAELARQKEDWNEIVHLAEKGLHGANQQKKFNKTNVAELSPFIEGYGRTGHWQEAIALSMQAFDSWENMRFMLCDLWSKIHQTMEMDAAGKSAYQEMTEILDCEVP